MKTPMIRLKNLRQRHKNCSAKRQALQTAKFGKRQLEAAHGFEVILENRFALAIRKCWINMKGKKTKTR